MKIRKIVTIIILPIMLFGLYVYKYHALAMEGWKLFNDRCNNVNPQLIRTINLHLALDAALSGQDSPSAEQFSKDLKTLPVYADQYTEVENGWLDKQETFINRWDFKLLEPGYIKSAGKHQLAMYQAYYNYYKTVANYFNSIEKAKETGGMPTGGENTLKLMDKYQNDLTISKKLYFESLNKGVETNDWRMVLGQVPEPNCPEENIKIPDISSPSGDK